jgi:hypothetical protein
MALNSNTKANVPFKLGLNFGHTSNSDEYFNEPFGSGFLIASQNIWGDSIDSDPATAQTNGIVSQEITLNLTKIPGTTGSGSSYITSLPSGEEGKLSPYTNPYTETNYTTGDRVGHLVPVFYGLGYKPTVKNGGGSVISEGDTSNWFLDPFGGIITLENATAVPATITCRVYVGKFLSTKVDDLVDELANAIISGGGIPYSEIERLDNEDIQIYSIIDALSGQIQAIPQDIASISDLLSASGNLQGNISVLDTRVTTNEGDIVSIQSDILSLSISGGSVLPSQIDDLQAQLDTISGAVDVVSGDLSTHVANTDNYNQIQDDAIADNLSLINQLSGNINPTILQNSLDISELQSETQSISGDVVDNTSDIIQLQADLAGAIISGGGIDLGTFNALEVRVSDNETDISSLSSSITGNASDISDNASDIIDLQNQQSINTADIATLQTTDASSLINSVSASLQADIATIESDLVSLSGDVSSNIISIADNALDIIDLQDQLDNIVISAGGVSQTQLDAVNDRIDLVELDIDSLSGAIDWNFATNQSLIFSVSGNVDALETTVDGFNSTISNNSNAISLVGDDVDTLQTQTQTISGDLVALEDLVNNLPSGGSGDVSTELLASISGGLNDDILSNTSNISNLQSQTQTISGDLNSLEQQFSDLDATYTSEAELLATSGNLQAQIGANTTALANLDLTYASEADLLSVSGNLQANISSNDSDITSLQSQFAGLGDTYIDNSELLATSGNLQAQIGTNTNALANLDATYASESELLSVSGNLQANISSNDADITSLQSQLSSIGDTYIDNSELLATSGNLQAQIGTNTNALANLDATYASEADLLSVSGNLQANISSNDSDITSLQSQLSSIGDTYIDNSELLATSGNLQAQIGANTTVLANLDAEYTTEAELLSVSGNLQANISSNGSDITSLQSQLSSIGDTYIDESELLATSGNLQAQIGANTTALADIDLGQYLPLVGGTVTGPLTVSDTVTVDRLEVNGDIIQLSGANITEIAQTLLVEDNIIIVNNGESGSEVLTGEAGIEVDRGNGDPYRFIFKEDLGLAEEVFAVGISGQEQPVATREEVPNPQGLTYWNDTDKRIDTSSSHTIDNVTKKYTQTIGNGADTTLDVDHNLGTRNVTYTIMNATTYDVVDADVTLATINKLEITFTTAPTTNQFIVTVIG